jgi:hypothetical protein
MSSGGSERRDIRAARLAGERHQIPAIAIEILEHRDLAIGHDGRRADEADAGRGVGGEVAVEIVGGKEKKDAASGLVADRGLLHGVGGAGEEDRSGVVRRAGRADRDPALVLFGLVAVFDDGEAELGGVEGQGFVIVSDDQGDVG